MRRLPEQSAQECAIEGRYLRSSSFNGTGLHDRRLRFHGSGSVVGRGDGSLDGNRKVTGRNRRCGGDRGLRHT